MIYVAWIVFFAVSVGGHIALTAQTRATPLPTTLCDAARFVTAPLTLLTVACWGASTILWVALLHKHGLMRASSVSSLRYILIVAAAAVVLHEKIVPKDAVGAALIAAGVFLVATR